MTSGYGLAAKAARWSSVRRPIPAGEAKTVILPAAIDVPVVERRTSPRSTRSVTWGVHDEMRATIVGAFEATAGWFLLCDAVLRRALRRFTSISATPAAEALADLYLGALALSRAARAADAGFRERLAAHVLWSVFRSCSAVLREAVGHPWERAPVTVATAAPVAARGELPLTEQQTNLLGWLRLAMPAPRRISGYEVRSAQALVGRGAIEHVSERFYRAVPE